MNHKIRTEEQYQKLLKQFFSKETVWEYSLRKIRAACDAFWNPEKSFTAIHIAGTNGKGSVSKMIFQVLKDSWKKVWVYTSPHLIDICERFETEDGLISQDDFISYAQQILDYDHALWYFEKCVLLAFLYFRDQACEYAVIEVGMWGRLDATNIVDPILTTITSIGYDHMEYLWDTLEEISYEKAGIIKSGVPLILYEKNKVIQDIAQMRWSEVIFSERDRKTNLLWVHQSKNAGLAYEVCKYLWYEGSDIESSLMSVNHRGRLDFVRNNVLIDGAHNEQWLQVLQDFLYEEKDNWKNIIYCIGIKKGKSLDNILNTFSENKDWYIVNSDNLLLESSNTLQEYISDKWYSAQLKNAQSIFPEAKKTPKTLYLVFGSLYLIQELMEKH